MFIIRLTCKSFPPHQYNILIYESNCKGIRYKGEIKYIHWKLMWPKLSIRFFK